MSTKTFFFKTKERPWCTKIYSIKRRWSDEVLFYRISHYQSESVAKSTPNTAGRCKGILYLSALIPTTKNQWSRDISHLFKSPTVQLSLLLWACCENSKSIDPKKALLLFSTHSLKLFMNSGSFFVSKVLTAVWKHLFTYYKKSFRVSPVSFPPDIIRYVSDYSVVYITQLSQVYHIFYLTLALLGCDPVGVDESVLKLQAVEKITPRSEVAHSNFCVGVQWSNRLIQNFLFNIFRHHAHIFQEYHFRST